VIGAVTLLLLELVGAGIAALAVYQLANRPPLGDEPRASRRYRATMQVQRGDKMQSAFQRAASAGDYHDDD
jgi:hypothetical protein